MEEDMGRGMPYWLRLYAARPGLRQDRYRHSSTTNRSSIANPELNMAYPKGPSEAAYMSEHGNSELPLTCDGEIAHDLIHLSIRRG